MSVTERAGALSPAERIACLLDAGSLSPAADLSGLVAGRGAVSGRPVLAFATEAGPVPAAAWRAVGALAEEAVATGAPLVGIHDAALLPAGDALPAFSAALAGLGRAEGAVPRLSLVVGACVGPAALMAAAADVVLATAEAALAMAGPGLVRAVTNERVTLADLGGARVLAERTGLADAVFADEVTALLQLRRLLDLLPSSAASGRPGWESFDRADRAEPALDSLVPADPVQAYDSRELVLRLVDERDVLALKDGHAQTLTIGLGRLDGGTVGIVASCPENLGGALDVAACRKAARFVRFCRAFRIPLLVVADSPGFLPGPAEEHAGALAAAADLAAAFAGTNVVTLYPRNAFGPAVAVLAPKPVARAAFAWPSARIGAVGPAGARDLLSAGGLAGADLAAAADDFAERHLTADAALQAGTVDAVIRPAETRAAVIAALAKLR